MRSGPTGGTAASRPCSRSSGASFRLPIFGSRCHPRPGSTSRRPRMACTERSRRSPRVTFTAPGGRRRSRCSSPGGRSFPARSHRGSTMRGGASERCTCARSRRTRRQDWGSAERSSAAAVRAGRELTRCEPYRETGYRLLMSALARQGNDSRGAPGLRPAPHTPARRPRCPTEHPDSGVAQAAPSLGANGARHRGPPAGPRLKRGVGAVSSGSGCCCPGRRRGRPGRDRRGARRRPRGRTGCRCRRSRRGRRCLRRRPA